MEIELHNRQRRQRLDLPALRRRVTLAAPLCLGTPGPHEPVLARLEVVEITLLSDRAIAPINRRFLQHEGPTDVITFEHGEILVSADHAMRHGPAHGKTFDQELLLYIIPWTSASAGLVGQNAGRSRPHGSRAGTYSFENIAPHMKSLLFPILGAALFLTPVPLPAEPPQPAVASQILQELDKIETERDAIMQRGWRAAAAAVSAAAQSKESAIDLYEQAVRETEFAGLSQESAQWREWKDNDGALLRATPGGKALLYQLRYTRLTMRRAFGEKVPELLSDVIGYVAALQNEIDDIVPDQSLKSALERAKRLGDQKRRQSLQKEMRERNFAQGLLKTGVGGSVIARYLGVDGELGKAEDWPQEPGNLDAILDQVVLPELREEKDARLFSFWEDKIKRAGQKALDLGTDFEKSRYETIEFPQLLWARAEDYLLFDQQTRALHDMLAAIRANPAHPKADQWIKKLRELLQPIAAPAPAAPSPSPSAEPENSAS